MRAATSAAVLLVTLVTLASPARAEPSEADRAFEAGRQQLAAGKYADACASFQKSQSLDPQLGTRFNIAQCEDKLGKLAPALVIYRDLAAHDTNAQRQSISAKRAADLESRVAHAHLKLAQRPAGVAITVDGDDVTAATDDVPVDIGTHTVVATLGAASKSTPFVVVAEPSSVDVDIDVPLPPPIVVAPPPPPAPSHRAAYIAFAASGATLAGGVVAGVLAHGSWSDAKSAASAGDPTRANQLADSATTRGDISTALFVVAGVAAAAGIGLYWHASHEHAAVTASVAPGGAALALTGRF